MSLLTNVAQAPENVNSIIDLFNNDKRTIENTIVTVLSSWDGAISIAKANGNLMNNYYNKFLSVNYNNKEELFSAFDNMIDDLEKELSKTVDDMTFDYAKGAFFIIAGIVTGSSVVATYAGLIGTTNEVLSSFISRVNFVAMRSYFQSRTSERFMYYEGWTDGRN